jgi:hypothetical protein
MIVVVVYYFVVVAFVADGEGINCVEIAENGPNVYHFKHFPFLTWMDEGNCPIWGKWPAGGWKSPLKSCWADGEEEEFKKEALEEEGDGPGGFCCGEFVAKLRAAMAIWMNGLNGGNGPAEWEEYK